MSLPLTRRIARAVLLDAAGAASVVGAAGAASAAELPSTADLGGLSALDAAAPRQDRRRSGAAGRQASRPRAPADGLARRTEPSRRPSPRDVAAGDSWRTVAPADDAAGTAGRRTVKDQAAGQGAAQLPAPPKGLTTGAPRDRTSRLPGPDRERCPCTRASPSRAAGRRLTPARRSASAHGGPRIQSPRPFSRPVQAVRAVRPRAPRLTPSAGATAAATRSSVAVRATRTNRSPAAP